MLHAGNFRWRGMVTDVMFISLEQLPDPRAVLADMTQPWVAAMHECEQDPRWHREGTVAVHTALVLDRLDELMANIPLGEQAQIRLRWAALFHDCGKPQTTRTQDDGSITSFGHSKRGSMIARSVLWRMQLDPRERELICGLVRWHMLPGHLMDRADIFFALALASQSCKLDELGVLARADAQGRIGTDGVEEALLKIGIFEDEAIRHDCLHRPMPFASDHARMVYFENAGERLAYDAFDDTHATLHVMCALPGIGKDTYIAKHLADAHEVSIDKIREQLKLDAGEWRISVPAAHQQLREALRTKTDVVFNATSLVRDHRAKVIRLGRSYGYRIRIVMLETDPQTQRKRNKNRVMAVPSQIIDEMLDKWEAPTLAEAHSIDIVDTTA